MPLQFILGRTGTGKTAGILDEIRRKLKDDPDGPPLIYLVPDQMTFMSEYKLIKTPGLDGTIRAQVLSFSRLAWRVLQETGGMSRRHLDSSGVNMMIRKIMEEKKEDLHMFRRSADKQGFIAQMEEMLKEFKRYCIDPARLEEWQAGEGEQPEELRAKLHDLELIYSQFERELAGKYLESEDYFKLLVDKMEESDYISSAVIYMDGFYSLTPQELLIVEKLLACSKGVTAALTLDRPFKDSPPDPLHLFRQTGSSYYEIYQAALKLGIPVEMDIILENAGRFAENPALKHLEEKFAVRPAVRMEGITGVTIIRAQARRSEVEGTAREILKLVRSSGCRWRDIAVLVRNGEAYHDLIRTIFEDYGIPVFIDTKHSMLNHPLIELVRSTLEILSTNWRYEPVFRAVKTELMTPIGQNTPTMRARIDRLENYVLSRGIKGSRWTSKEPWGYRRIRGLELEDRPQTTKEIEFENDLNELKEMFTAPVLKLSRRLKRAESGREFCEALYLYLEELHIPEKLDKLKFEAEDAGNLTGALEHEQAWDAVISLLDQYVEMLGEEPATLKKFTAVLETGMESLKFSMVPPAIDQVLTANLNLSRIDDVRAVFVLGLNEGVLPGRVTAEGIFTDRDRNALLAGGMEVAPSSEVRLLDEEFTAYKAFTSASELLYLSYPVADEEGKALLESSYMKRIRDLVEVEESVYSNDPSVYEPEEQTAFAANYRTSLTYLTSQLQQLKRSYPIAPLWWDVYHAYLDNEEERPRALRVLSGLFYANQTKRLTEETSRQLYGDSIQASVSRMEMFNSCPFSHFAAHGLRLQERKVYRLDAPDIGEMFHGALKIISDYLYEHRIAWSSLTKEQCLLLAKNAVEKLAPKLQNQILLSTNRHHYLKRKLEDVIGRASIVLSEQAKASGFAPIGLEVAFGKNGQIPPLTFKLQNGTKMELVGRIDRVDQAVENDGIYLRVLDYKSSDRDLNISEVYYGLALQMLTYLDVIISHSRTLVGKEADPAGVLYFHVHNPVIKSSGMMKLDEIEEAVFKSFKMKGLVLGEPDVVQLMDTTLGEEKSKSDMIPVTFKKDGSMDSRSRIASREEFGLLRKHVRSVFQHAGDEIVNGNVEIEPYRFKDKVPCTFCPYKSVCQFDQSLEENEYKVLAPKKDSDVLELLRKGEFHE